MRAQTLEAGAPPAAAVVVAVKPHQIEAALRRVRADAAPGLLVSVAAGVRLEQLREAMGPGWRCARLMPTLAVEWGAGAVAGAAGPDVKAEDRALCARLAPSSAGPVWLDESLMDLATAVVGSGPAYFLRLAEVLAAAGEAEGLPPSLARRLVADTLAGAAAMAAHAPQDIAGARRAITSPGGTTQAGLAALDGDGALARLAAAAVSAATDRARVLALGAAGAC